MKLAELNKHIEDLMNEECQGEEYTADEIDDMREVLLLTPLEIDLDLVEVRECKNRPGDNGVFAKVDIKKGELITLYPVDTYENKKRPNLKMEHHTNHILKISLTKIISGDPNSYSPSYCGHMCNDGAKYVHSSDEDENEKKSEIYEKISKLKQNADIAILNKLIPCIIATKDIQPNQEILLHYGTQKWKSIS